MCIGRRVVVVAVLAVLTHLSWAFGGSQDKVRLRDVQTLTLRQGQWTTGRRSASVKQVQCVGGSAGTVFQPQIVQCYNRGSDGTDIQWECKTDMSGDYRFGDISITCEGYDYPEDEFVLKGSCGLEYTLDYTEEGLRKRGGTQQQFQQPPSYGFKKEYTQEQTKNKTGFDLSSLVVLGMICFVIYIVYVSCIGDRGSGDGRHPGGGGGYPGGGGGYPGGGGPPPPGFRPDPSAPPSYEDTCGGNSQSRSSNAYQRRGGGGAGGRNDGPGFWTGLGLGGLGGYLFGGNRGYGGNGYGGGGYQRRQYGYGHDQPSSSNFFGGGGGGMFGGGGGAAGTSSSSSSSTRTASGFGGTKRR